jgi:hypothetical protein
MRPTPAVAVVETLQIGFANIFAGMDQFRIAFFEVVTHRFHHGDITVGHPHFCIVENMTVQIAVTGIRLGGSDLVVINTVEP